MEQIDVKMNNVEFLRALAHLVNHQHEMRNGVLHGRIKAEWRAQQGISWALVMESPLANSVTSCPSLTSSSVENETTLSVPP
jgi:hypothetical protein